MKKLVNLAACVIVSALASLGAVYALAPIIAPLPFVFANNTVANATQVNADLAAIVNGTNAFQTNGTWTVTDISGAGLNMAASAAGYTQIGNMMFAYATVVYPATVDSHVSLIDGLPLALPASLASRQCNIGWSSIATSFIAYALPVNSGNGIGFWNSTATNLTNAALSGATIQLECIYPVS